MESLEVVQTAHPRVSGENTWKAVFQGIADGSSPRERGKHHRRISGKPKKRLIPA